MFEKASLLGWRALLIICVAIFGFQAAQASAVPRFSFLVHTAKNVDDLVQQCNDYPEVMDRYSRHFAMTSSQLVSYFRSLRVVRLTNDRVFTVYSVPKNGRLHAHPLKLHKGERVFVDPQGGYVLRALCGNPMCLGPRRPFMPSKEAAMVAVPVNKLRELAALPDMGTPENETIALPATEPVMPETFVADVPMPPLIDTVHFTEASQFPFFAFLPLLAYHHDHPPVPEPMTFVAFGACAATLIRSRTKPKPRSRRR